jgi:MarR family transcriptional regulator, organic hydroperoxide resistance regulator
VHVASSAEFSCPGQLNSLGHGFIPAKDVARSDDVVATLDMACIEALWSGLVRMLVVATGPASHGRVPTSTAASAGPVSNALIRVTRLHMILARYLLQRVGLHPGQELLLMHLWDAGPQRQADLASEFGTDSASMTRTVQRLERAGFVRRRPDPTDGRATLVESTEAGTALRGRIEELWAELETQTVGDLSPAQLGQLLLGLENLEENLSLATDSARMARG